MMIGMRFTHCECHLFLDPLITDGNSRNDLQTSCAWSANKRMRELAVEEMRRLVAKYPDGFEGYSPDTTEVAECSSK